ncbi:(d)CMP kinase [Salinibacillus aidingensis]|uniref:Cytidylate kinase n=1 Tax=Salinibacillus aidingensis TaxID=237684 RepID=A0ABN1APH3_9BACI
MKRDIAIAIDGPAAAGKSTVAKIVAKHLSYVYIDTGAMYRALTLKAIQHQLNVDNETEIVELLNHTSIQFKQNGEQQLVYLDDADVTHEIRSQEVTHHVSDVSKHKEVREEMVQRQQQLARSRGVVMDGRDIGTHVIPDAEVKVFLIASVDERAKRRHKENVEKGYPSNLEELKKEIQRRDQIDSQREVSPLIKAEDAIEIDTTSYTINEVAERILEIVSSKI